MLAKGTSSSGRIRVSAWLVVVLYLFLSTFGPLTHTHVSSIRKGQANQTQHVDLPQHDGTSPIIAQQTDLSASADCAFCLWQTLTPPLTLAAPQIPSHSLVSLQPSYPQTPICAFFLARFSSRAPPLA